MRFFLLFIVFLLNISQSSAEEHFGLAMHGVPKYELGFEYLDYVNPKAPKGGTLKMSAIGTFDNLNPFAIKGKGAEGLNLFYDRLMTRVWDEPFTLYPLIAEKVDIPPDRSAITVYINQKARFHDGSAITADDIIFSFEILRDFGRPNMRRIYKLVQQVKKLDEFSIHFDFGPGFDQETVMILAMMPVLSKSWWEGKAFNSTILEVPNGNGPYMIHEIDPGRRIVFKRVEDYWAADLPINRGHFNFEQIIYDYYRDDTVAFEAFKSGAFDLRREWNAGNWARDYNFKGVSEGLFLAETFPHGRPERVQGLIINTRREPFDDVRVREALSYLFDFEWINKNYFHGGYKRINSYFPNTELAAVGVPSEAELSLLEPWKEALPKLIFGTPYKSPMFLNSQSSRSNFQHADHLLSKAGWVIDNGIRVNEKGKKFEFEILLDSPENEKIALAYVRNLERLGIKARVRVLDSAAYRGRLQVYDFDMTQYYWHNSLSPGTEQMLYWSCDSAKQAGQWNFAGICDPAVDSLVKGIANASSRDELVAHARALDRVLTYGNYMVPLYYLGKDYVAYKSFIKHTSIIPLYGVVLETWWANIRQ